MAATRRFGALGACGAAPLPGASGVVVLGLAHAARLIAMSRVSRGRVTRTLIFWYSVPAPSPLGRAGVGFNILWFAEEANRVVPEQLLLAFVGQTLPRERDAG